jgi:hypothetical protein
MHTHSQLHRLSIVLLKNVFFSFFFGKQKHTQCVCVCVCVCVEIDLHWVRALTVPMHLGLTDGPFVPCNLISAQDSPVPLPRFQMAPIFKILMSSVSKKGTKTYYSFLSKRPGKRIPSRFPNGAPWRERPYLLICLFDISFGFPSKGALPPGPPHRVPSERDTPFLEPSFIHHSKYSVRAPPLLIPGSPRT